MLDLRPRGRGHQDLGASLTRSHRDAGDGTQRRALALGAARRHGQRKRQQQGRCTMHQGFLTAEVSRLS